LLMSVYNRMVLPVRGKWGNNNKACQ